MDQPNYRDEIDRLLILERSNTLDVTIRMIGVPFAGLMYYLYTAEFTGFYWSIGYVACYASFRLYMASLGPFVSYKRQVSVHLMVALLTVSYLWLPTEMLVSADRSLAMAGAALVMSQLMHMVHRGDTSLFLIRAMTLAVFATMFGYLLVTLPELTNPVAIVGILGSWIAVVFYMGQSMHAARCRILAENEAKSQNFQAQKLAALGQLAGGIAHDFNNILTAILGNLELFKEVNDPAEKEELIAAAQESSERAAKIVGQILIYARKSRVEPALVDANDPLESIKVLTQHLIPSNVHLSIEPLGSARQVRIDLDQFITALMNLVLNAVDAITGTGQITLSVDAEQITREQDAAGGLRLRKGNYVVYCVSDTGSGIPENILANVADPFFTTKPVGKGTGLGLSLAVSIAESVGGALQINSSSQGTKISVFVPDETQTEGLTWG